MKFISSTGGVENFFANVSLEPIETLAKKFSAPPVELINFI